MVKLEGLNTAAAGVSGAGNAYQSYLATKAARQGEERREAEGQRLAETFKLGTQKLKMELAAFEQDREQELRDEEAMREGNVLALDALEGTQAFLPPEWRDRFANARDLAAKSGPAGTQMLKAFGAMMGTAAIEHARDKTRAKVYQGQSRIEAIANELRELAGATNGQNMDLGVDVDGDGQDDYTINTLEELGQRFVEAIDDPNQDPTQIAEQFDAAIRSLEVERGKLRTRLQNYNKWMGRIQDVNGPYAFDRWADDDMADAWVLLENYRVGEFQGSNAELDEELEALANKKFAVEMHLDDNTRARVLIDSAEFRARKKEWMKALRGDVNPAAQRVVGDLQAWQRAVSAAAPKDMTGDEAREWMRGAMGDAVDQINAVYDALGLPSIPNTYRGSTAAQPESSRGSTAAQPRLSEREVFIEQFKSDPQHVFAVFADRFTQRRGRAQGPPAQTLKAVFKESGFTDEDLRELGPQITATIDYLQRKGLWK